MTEEQYKEYNQAALSGTIKDEENPIFAFSMTSTKLLTEMLAGKYDIEYMMKKELKNRGLNEKGEYIGFNKG